MFVLNMLPEIVRELSATVDRVTLDRVSVIDTGGGDGRGSGLGRFVTRFPAAVLSLSEQISTATGVDLLGALARPEPDSGAPEGKPAPESEPAAAGEQSSAA